MKKNVTVAVIQQDLLFLMAVVNVRKTIKYMKTNNWEDELGKVDFPTAWRIVKSSEPKEHHEKCSWRVGGMLCDCAFIEAIMLTREDLKSFIQKQIDEAEKRGYLKRAKAYRCCFKECNYHSQLRQLNEWS